MITIKNTPIFSSIFSVLLIGMLSACGGGGSSPSDSTAAGSSPSSTTVSAVIGPAGGSLSSSDGNTTLTVPAGALASDTKITMTEVSGSDIPAELQDPSVLKVYDMQPDGLQFATPATVEVHTLGSTAHRPNQRQQRYAGVAGADYTNHRLQRHYCKRACESFLEPRGSSFCGA